MMTSPPLPPSPPDGPPRGTNFSRRKARQPLPPSPAFTRIVASSMNMEEQVSGVRYQVLGRTSSVLGRGQNGDSCSQFANPVAFAAFKNNSPLTSGASPASASEFFQPGRAVRSNEANSSPFLRVRP